MTLKLILKVIEKYSCIYYLYYEAEKYEKDVGGGVTNFSP